MLVSEDPKRPTDKAKHVLEKGFSSLLRAAEGAKKVVEREAKKTGGLGKAVDDAGREVVRAASNVATFLGSELSGIGKKLGAEVEPHAEATSGSGTEEDWPKTREEYERKYGKDGDDWPKSREEYERKYGRPPRKRGDDDDPGFRIATPHD